VELISSVGIFSALLAIAVPNMVATIPATRLNGAARQVLGDLMWARGKAAQENIQFVVTFSNDGVHYTILADRNGNGTADVGETTKTQNIQLDYSDVTIAISGPNPTFNSRGTAGATTTVTLTNSSGTRTVTVGSTGGVKIN
jgi:type IV fimbrial biogenesis protein FimT